MIVRQDLEQEINRLILNPLGLTLGSFGFRGVPVDTCIHVLDPDAARRIADEIERCGAERLRGLGYVVQPLPPEVKQLHVTVRETVALPDDVELELPEEFERDD